MNIKVLDSWIREYLKTTVKPEKFAEAMSLTSVSIERIEKIGSDFAYEIEITTNRPDLASVIGLAREASAVLPQFGIEAKFEEPKFKKIEGQGDLEVEIIRKSDAVNRICAVALNVKNGESPAYIKERLQASDINPHNSLIDVTNYVMREVGHPMHVFDYDKLAKFGKLIIREAKAGEKIVDLHNTEHTLAGGDIVADDGTGTIIDLLGVIGTKNSSVDDDTKRVLLFVDNNEPSKIRKTSMSLAVRTDAAVLNEKGVDAELALKAIERGVQLLADIADGKVISKVFDKYPNKPSRKTVTISQEKINSVLGVDIGIKASAKILEDLGFDITVAGQEIKAVVPSSRSADVQIPEDLVEEVARIYGYFKLPSILPANTSTQIYNQAQDLFYFEKRARSAMKYWGATEVYTYPMVSEDLLEGPMTQSVTIKNPLTDDHIYMRTTLVPSLLSAIRENKNRKDLMLFEIANVYHKKTNSLPDEKLMFATIIKKDNVSFFEAKGMVEQILADFGVKNYEMHKTKSASTGADVYIEKDFLGQIEHLEENIVDFEIDFEILMKHATLAKIYKPSSHFPKAYEDLRFEIDPNLTYEKIVKTIREQSNLIVDVSLLDVYKNKKTFTITYQSEEKNLTNEDIKEVREKIISALKTRFKAELV